MIPEISFHENIRQELPHLKYLLPKNQKRKTFKNSNFKHNYLNQKKIKFVDRTQF